MVSEIPIKAPQIQAPLAEGLSDFEDHPWVQEALEEYDRCAIIASQAKLTIVHDLFEIDQEHRKQNKGRALFTVVESRVKSRNSYLGKLFRNYKQVRKKQGMTKEGFSSCRIQIQDVLGLRFAVPYFDQVIPTVQEVRKKLLLRNYAVDLATEGLQDINYLENGDENGYRSCHFFVRVPTLVDLYGNTEMYLCELQARTELEHVWAVKSHNLFYKPHSGWKAEDGHVKEDMKQISNELRAIDQHLVSIRDRLKEETTND